MATQDHYSAQLLTVSSDARLTHKPGVASARGKLECTISD